MTDQVAVGGAIPLRRLIRQEIARLTDGRLEADDIADDEPLFSIPGECDSRVELDSLDALELAFAIEEATGVSQPPELDLRELLTVAAIVWLVERARGGTPERDSSGLHTRDSETAYGGGA